MTEPTKISVTVPISEQLLAQGWSDNLFQLLTEAAKPGSQKAAEWRQQQEEKAKPIQQAARERHLAALGRIDPLLHPVLNLHEPVFWDERSMDPDCKGCDPGGYAEYDPPWPCTTWELVAGENEDD